MTDYPIARFVDSLSPDAATRFDFHDPGHTSTNPASWLWTPGGLLGEPDSINPSYGLGSLTFELQVHTSHSGALQVMAALGRELRRSGNFLLFQLDDVTAPGWLEVYPSSPGALGFPYAKPGTDDSVWIIPVSLTTSGTILGERVTHEITIQNDPTETNGLAVELPEIAGDAPAPLIVSIGPTAQEYVRPYVGVIALDEDWPGVQYWQAESFTLAGGTAVAAAASASGGSVAKTTFSGTTSARRMTGSLTLPFAGRWRLFARMQAEGGSGESVTVTSAGDALVEPVTSTIAAGTAPFNPYRIIDLGTYVFPRGNYPTSRPYTLAPGDVGIDAAGSIGGGVLFLSTDYVIAVPLDLPLEQVAPGAVLDFDVQTQLRGGDTLVLNSEVGVVEATTAGLFDAAAAYVPHGSFPQVVPGAVNVLHLLSRRSGLLAFAGDLVGSTAVLTLTYRPRHVYLPGA